VESRFLEAAARVMVKIAGNRVRCNIGEAWEYITECVKFEMH
jgi:hypothetical protein